MKTRLLLLIFFILLSSCQASASNEVVALGLENISDVNQTITIPDSVQNQDFVVSENAARYENLYRAMLRIRCFEEKVLSEFASGYFRGTTHTYIGQEANAVGVLTEIGNDDVVVSNHRSHGHFLAYGGDMQALFSELMGKPSGVCGGRGGSQHLHWKNFYSNGVLGGTSPIASGIALADKMY